VIAFLTQVWDIKELALDAATPAKLRVTAAVAAHDKDINAVAVAPNDSRKCAGCRALRGACSNASSLHAARTVWAQTRHLQGDRQVLSS